ncbi:SAM-dependent methyltransferase [Pseudoalteromonas porphyrae]|uniref:Class I SAM-dependent methyltransferase n=1 Tax=Pseudoalteromonas neustonica TaxID=1840331 RepID=A0ABU9U7K7_9GAMM|nr:MULTISPECIES: class I SAM-dependent methyltransferase [Pseudoalteromonas]KPH93966.1 SAM-dependent methyltransferase [Pseudoalteromonas porphyrae]NNG45082.1 class I SAM-dependent methyltransferase [Pseudoalteromonas sp. NEC-BIFX-2020_002]
MIGSKVFWNKSAIKYAKTAIKDIKTYQKKLSITQQYLNKESEVLEFGCGSGGTAIIHAPFVKQIVATDISEKMIEIAKNKAIECNVKNVIFRQNTLDELILHNQDYDVILGLNVIHLLEDVDNSINYVYKLLKNNGVFISSTSLIGEVNLVLRLLLSLMQFIGLAPYVSVLTKNQFISKLNKAGFSVEFEWQTSSESIFIVAKK